MKETFAVIFALRTAPIIAKGARFVKREVSFPWRCYFRGLFG
jgi:hypothetical protein